MLAVASMILISLSLSLSLSLSGEFITFIQASKINLVSRMREVYTVYFTPYENIFDEFYGYLETGVSTGNLCDLEEKFTKVRSTVFFGRGGEMKLKNHVNVPSIWCVK